jgi:predicted nucleic acid-binding protein
MNGMTDNCLVLDTNAVIFLTTRDNVIPNDLENELNKSELFISVITRVEIRRTTNIKLPDCIIAATAIVLDAVLVTNDVHLLHLSRPDFNVKAIISDTITG